MSDTIPYLERNAPLTLKGRARSIRIASSDGQIDALMLGSVFGVLKAAYWTAAQVRSRPLRDLGGTFIVSDKCQFAFCGIPKVGTKSIHRALLDSPGIEAFAVKWAAGDVRLPDITTFKSHYKFSFVRNPWDRVVSCYRNKILRPPTIGALQILAAHPGLAPGMPFDAFVRWLCSSDGSDEHADRHWISQSFFVTDSAGRIVCDFIGKLERIEADFKAVCEALQLPSIKIPHHRKSAAANEQSHYRDFYSDEAKALVAKRYERDIDVFGYTF